jgi:multiple sugar transport system ATP-binding protein
MHDGIVEQIGAPLDLYDRPANLFVAGFIGSPAMNFLKGTVEPNGFRTIDGIMLPLKSTPPTAASHSAVYGVRPEHFVLSKEGVPARVSVIEPTGSEMQIVARIGGQEVICVFRERITPRPGDMIHIMPDPNLIHIFDEQTGKRL